MQGASAYRNGILKQLSDNHTYETLKSNPMKIYKERQNTLVHKEVMVGVFSKEEIEILVPQYPTMAVF